MKLFSVPSERKMRWRWQEAVPELKDTALALGKALGTGTEAGEITRPG